MLTRLSRLGLSSTLALTMMQSIARAGDDRPKCEMRGHAGMVMSVTFSPDGKTLATGGEDRTVRIWDIPSGQPKGEPLAAPDQVLIVAYSPDGKTLAASGGGMASFERVTLRDAATLAQRLTLPGISCAYSSDGKRFVTWEMDGSVHLWDTATDDTIGSFDLSGTKASGNYSVAISSDGGMIAFAEGGLTPARVLIRDVRTKRPISTLEKTFPWCMFFSPDGETLIASHESDIILWDVKTGQRRAILHSGKAQIGEMARSSDGKRFAVGRADGTVQLWDIAERRVEGIVSGHKGEVTAVAFSRDGTWLASGDHEGTVRLWDVAGIIARGPEPSPAPNAVKD